MTPRKTVTPHELIEQREQFESGIDVTEIHGDMAERILRVKFDVVPHVRGEKVIALRASVPDYWALVHTAPVDGWSRA